MFTIGTVGTGCPKSQYPAAKVRLESIFNDVTINTEIVPEFYFPFLFKAFLEVIDYAVKTGLFGCAPAVAA